MSTIDTSTWNPDPALNESIGDIPLNESASIKQTWQAIQMLMAAGGLHGLQLVTFDGATASADGASGLVPAPEAGDQDKVLKGDGTWGTVDAASVSGLQTALDAKADDSGVVHTTGSETIGGTKTFSSGVIFGSTAGCYKAVATSAVHLSGGSAYNKGGRISMFGESNATYAGYVQIRASASATKMLEARPDGTLTWDGQAIQTASDERLKTPLSQVPDEVLDAWEDVAWGQFQYLEAAAEKGEAARLHLGLVAQRVRAVFDSHGLDACAYGILCYDEEAGLWTVRYAEALAMEAACQRRRADRLEARIAALEVQNA